VRDEEGVGRGSQWRERKRQLGEIWGGRRWAAMEERGEDQEGVLV
jgi:hypothetical protein